MADEVDLPKKKPDKAVKLPETASELFAARLKNAENEDDARRTKRRTEELSRPLAAHTAAIADAHRLYPAPLHRKWKKFTRQEKKNWNTRRKKIDAANRSYYEAVRDVSLLHQAENDHLAKLRRERIANKGAA